MSFLRVCACDVIIHSFSDNFEFLKTQKKEEDYILCIYLPNALNSLNSGFKTGDPTKHC